MMRRRMVLVLVFSIVAAGERTGVTVASPPAATSGELRTTPTTDDAAKSAAEEQRRLSPLAVQVDCRPGMATFPPFTRSSGLPGGSLHVLSDGRCFSDGPSRPMEPLLVAPHAALP